MASMFCYDLVTYKPRLFAYAKTKAQISCAVTAQLISACFRYKDSTITLLLISKVQDFSFFSVGVYA